MGATSIEWTDTTWNPVTGCTKVSPGCDFCYAETMTRRFPARGPFETVQLHPDRLDQPLRWKNPRMIFVPSMGDLFHREVPWDFIVRVFDVMVCCSWHTFQVLTKRPGRMAYFAEHIWPKAGGRSERPDPTAENFKNRPIRWPGNVWAGTSVESQKYAPRLDVLAKVPASVRFCSYEPALGPVDFRPWLDTLSWLIAGGESGPGARPADPEWFRQARDQCQVAGVRFFFKQAGSVLAKEWRIADRKGGDITEWPDEFKVRQFPSMGGPRLHSLNPRG